MRIGAILALERISQDSQRDHWPVIEILTAYLKNNTSLEKNPLPKEVMNKINSIINTDLYFIPEPRVDIQLIMRVLGRRSWGNRVISYFKNQRLDLRSLNLCEIDLQKANLGFANFSETYLVNSVLYEANFKYSNFSNSNLKMAYSYKVNFQNANLYKATLFYVNLFKANLKRANLSQVNLTKANLSQANLKGAFLHQVDLQRTNLIQANLRDADLSLLTLIGFNEERLEKLQKQLNLTYGNEKTSLAESFKRPEHWGKSWQEQSNVIYSSKSHL